MGGKTPQKNALEASEDSRVKCSREGGGGAAIREEVSAEQLPWHGVLNIGQSALREDLLRGEGAGTQPHRIQSTRGSRSM